MYNLGIIKINVIIVEEKYHGRVSSNKAYWHVKRKNDN